MNYIQLIIISLAVASISFTISKSSIFKQVRFIINKYSSFFGELFSCPYCISHWISFIFCVYYYNFNVTFIVMLFANVTLSMIWIGFINRALDFLPPND